MNANIFFSLLRIVLAGTSLGTFLYVNSLPVAQSLTDGSTIPKLLWGISSLATFWRFLWLTNVALLLVWLLYSFFQGRLSARAFSETAVQDSYCYLPFTFLLLFLTQFNTFLASYFEGLLLFSEWNGTIALFFALSGLVYLKIRIHTPFTRTSKHFTKTSSAMPGIKTCTILFLCAFAIYTGVSARVKEKLPPGGDEPHYLLITHSLLHDGDLAIRNNYKQRDYKHFFEANLDPHISIARDGTQYSIHPVGAPVLLLPFYAAKGYHGALIGMNLMAAGLSLLLFLIAYSHIQQFKISLLLWGLVSFTPPLLVYSSQIYPEIPSAFFLAWAYYLITSRKYFQKGGLALLCLLLAGLPWLQSRMILATVLLFCYHAYCLWEAPYKRKLRQHLKQKELLLPAASLTVSGLLMAAENFIRFHSIFPNASYQSVGIESVFSWTIFIKEGVLGLLFDQEAGLFMYAPYFIISIIGALFLWKKERSKLIFCLLIIAGIYIPCAGFTLKWRGAWSPAGRYMVAQIPFWYVLLTVGTRYALQHTFSRYVFLSCTILSFGWTSRFFENPFAMIMRNIGVNRYFEQESVFLKLPHYFPSFTPHASGSLLLTSLWFAMILAFSCYVYYRFQSPKALTTHSLKSSAHGPIRSLFSVYALLAFCCILWTFFTIVPERTLHASKQQRTNFFHFFSQLRYDNILSASRFPVNNDDVTFMLFSRSKTARPHQLGPRFIISGPREPFLRGKYTALFELTLKEAGDESKPIVELEIVARRGIHKFATRSLFTKDFPSLNQRVQFFVPFELVADIKDLETRIFFHNNGKVEVSQISVTINEQELYYQTALRAIQKNRYILAQNLLKSVRQDTYPLRAYYLALIEQQDARWAESLQLLRSATYDNPDFADAYYRQGVAYTNLQQPEEAEQAFLTAISLLPNHLDALRALEHLYLQQERLELARETTQQLSMLYAPHHSHQIDFGNLVRFMGYSFEQATANTINIDYYWQALDSMPVNYSFAVSFKNSSDVIQKHRHSPHKYISENEPQQQYSTSHWKTGELIRERYELELPDRPSEIILGIGDPHFTGKRLTLSHPSSTTKRHEIQIPLKEKPTQ